MIIAFFSLFFLILNCIAQDNCNCEQALRQLSQKVETDYPGFNDKTKDKLLYTSFKENLLIKAQNTSDSNSIELLRSCPAFFKDGHISISSSAQKQNIQQIKKTALKVAISSEDFKKRISKTTDPLEGIWKSGNYKVGIVRLNNEYQGFIIKADTTYWKVNEIKFRLFENGKANYYFWGSLHTICNRLFRV